MASLATLEQRIRALEARLAEVEGGYGDTLYRLRRDSIGTRIELGRLLDQAGVAPGERRGDRRDSGRRGLTPADASAAQVRLVQNGSAATLCVGLGALRRVWDSLPVRVPAGSSDVIRAMLVVLKHPLADLRFPRTADRRHFYITLTTGTPNANHAAYTRSPDTAPIVPSHRPIGPRWGSWPKRPFQSACAPAGDGRPAGATAVVAFVVAFARDQQSPGVTGPGPTTCPYCWGGHR